MRDVFGPMPCSENTSRVAELRPLDEPTDGLVAREIDALERPLQLSVCRRRGALASGAGGMPELVAAPVRRGQVHDAQIPLLALHERQGEICGPARPTHEVVAEADQQLRPLRRGDLVAHPRRAERAPRPLEQLRWIRARRSQQVRVAPARDLDAVEGLRPVVRGQVDRDHPPPGGRRVSPEDALRQPVARRTEEGHPLPVPLDEVVVTVVTRERPGVERRPDRASQPKGARPEPAVPPARPEPGEGREAPLVRPPLDQARLPAVERDHQNAVLRRWAGHSQSVTPWLGSRSTGGPVRRVESTPPPRPVGHPKALSAFSRIGRKRHQTFAPSGESRVIMGWETRVRRLGACSSLLLSSGGRAHPITSFMLRYCAMCDRTNHGVPSTVRRSEVLAVT